MRGGRDRGDLERIKQYIEKKKKTLSKEKKTWKTIFNTIILVRSVMKFFSSSYCLISMATSR